MSKNIEDIGLTRYCGGCSSSEHQQRNYAEQGRACCPDGDQKYVLAKDVQQALTDKKLCVPLSHEDIFLTVRKYASDFEVNIKTHQQKSIASLIYQAQFGGNK